MSKRDSRDCILDTNALAKNVPRQPEKFQMESAITGKKGGDTLG